MLIDSHCHLDMYDEAAAVIERAAAAGVRRLLAIGIGDGPADMHRALDLAEAHPQVFASAGIHPQEAARADAPALAELRRLAAAPRCIAIGEIGLDYYHLDNPLPPVQHRAFIDQMAVAAEFRKPILIHCRTAELAQPPAKAKFAGADCAEDLLQLIAAHWQPTGLPGVMHCFSGDLAFARRSLDLGFYLSFAGNLTYPRSTAIQEVARWAPEDRILVETDAPFLTPVPLRGQRNEPAHTALTAAFLADLRATTPERIAAITTANFERLFPSTAVL